MNSTHNLSYNIYTRPDLESNIELVVKNKNGYKTINTEMDEIKYISVKLNPFITNLNIDDVIIDFFMKYIDFIDKRLNDHNIVWLNAYLNYTYNTFHFNIVNYSYCDDFIDKIPSLFEIENYKMTINNVECNASVTHEYNQEHISNFDFFYKDN